MGPLRGLAGADHQVLRLGAGVGGEGVAGAAEGRAAEGAVLPTDEDQPVRARLGVVLQVPAELPAEERGTTGGCRDDQVEGVAAVDLRAGRAPGGTAVGAADEEVSDG